MYLATYLMVAANYEFSVSLPAACGFLNIYSPDLLALMYNMVLEMILPY